LKPLGTTLPVDEYNWTIRI